jgi:hypothetical protein
MQQIVILVLCTLYSWNCCEAWTVQHQVRRSTKLLLQQQSYQRALQLVSKISAINDNANQDVNGRQLDSGTMNDKELFWNSQQELARKLSTQTKVSLRQEQFDKFEKRRLALVIDTAYIAWFIFCACWLIFTNPMTAVSYAFGATMGIAYTYGLGKSVEVIGQSIDDVGATQGAGVGEARFAFLIILFLFVGKFRGGEFGVQEIPSIAGFFTYQIASLNQGLRQIND